MKRKVTFFLLVVLVCIAVSTTFQSKGLQAVHESARYTFGEEMIFEVSTNHKLKEALLFYRISDYNPRERLLIEGDGYLVIGGVDWRHRQATLDRTEAEVAFLLWPGVSAPAAEVTYFWQLEDAQGNSLLTEEKTFLYLDPQFPWRSQKHGAVTLFWYEREEEFVETTLAQVDQAFIKIDERVGLGQKKPIKIIAYLDPDDWAPAVDPVSCNEAQAIAWQNTFAFLPESSTVDQVVQGDILTHELTHLLVQQNYQLQPGIQPGTIPFWLSEGLATYADGYNWGRWGTEPTSLLGAYGQAESLVTFLIEEHGGKEKIHQLLTTIAEGATVDVTLLATYGFDQQGLKEAWLDWLALREATHEPILDVSQSTTEN